ncbi:MAG: hypothetical protein KDA91_25800 [Planctomycetaceae bacterium]|nr:hypothetical protein [Planctomycetaceae bacterium]
MTQPRRRLTFQLTPLLDLLLIVIFAQYMEVRQNAQSAEVELQQKQRVVEAREQQLAEEFADRKRALEELHAGQVSDVQALRSEYRSRFQSIVDQQYQAGSALADAMQLPGNLMEQVTQLKNSGDPEAAERLEAATVRLREVIAARGTEFVRYVLKYDEMQKRVSIWEIHVDDNGQARISDGEQLHVVGFESEEEFTSRVFEASKSFASPRTLVLLLLSYGDAQAGYRRRATNAMPALIDRLRQDSGNTRWFDFSLMGFRPDGSVFGHVDSGEEK